MNTVIINTFDGGHAEDVRTFATNQSESSVNFDITTNPHLLRPYSDPVAETISSGSTVMTDFQITDVIAIDIDYGGTTKLIGLGRESAASGKVSFFTKTSPITSAWALVATGAATTPNGAAAPGTLVEYKGDAYAATIQPNLLRFTSATSIDVIGTMGSQNADLFVCKPFVHPEDNILYFASTSVIGKYDGTTFTATALTLPLNMIITSLTSYGGYLAIACKPKSGSGRSVVYLWGRDTSLTTVQASIDWGDGALEILENINESLIGISAVKAVGTFDTITNYGYKVKQYAGGTVQVLKDFTVTNTNVLRPWKAKQYDKLYFGFDTDNAIYVTGRNKQGLWYVSKDRYLSSGAGTITGTLNGLSIIGDILFTSYTDGGTTGYFMRTSDSTYALSSVYITSINPGMPVADRYEEKKLVSVQIAYRLNSSSGTVGLGYYCEDFAGTLGGTLKAAISTAKSATGDYVTTATAHTDNTPFLQGREFQFRITSIGDVRIKEVKYKYQKLNTI